jgi:eukaryotic-like serine/threonine-protein kinase
MVEPPSFETLIGTTLGNYRLEKLIEPSEVAPVFLASTGTAGAMYRLRILRIPAELSSDQRIVYLGRFQQEANSVSALRHPSILPLLDYGNANGMPYLVWAYSRMKPLNNEISKGAMDLVHISRYLDAIASALEHAHEHAVLHRNLTTDSIFIKDGTPLVADFGVLRMLQLAQPDGKSDPLYGMNLSSSPAPEQVQGKPVDTRTDVYALGAVLYRMLTGHRVFRGKTLKEIAELHAMAQVPSLSMWRSGLPRELDNVIAKAMAKEPTARFSQPGALANAYAQVVVPNDTSRTPFVITSPRPVSGPSPMPATPLAAPAPPLATSRPAARSTSRISRRRALTLLAAGGGGAVAVAAIALIATHLGGSTAAPTSQSGSQTTSPSGTGSQPTSAPGHTGTVIARTSEVPLNSAKKFPIANSNNPGLLIHLPNNQFVAFNSTCTHAGCAVNYNPQDKLLECPCHGAVFDPAKNAAVVNGPAQTPLAPIKITVNADGTITTT